MDFLYQAWAQRTARQARVADSWPYFLYGRTCVMEEVFQRRITGQEFQYLSRAGECGRPPLPTNPDSQTGSM